tara:strand:+ start:5435 stop:5746 length:312 start_codon:yes stop_codon:yes gene_type:complete
MEILEQIETVKELVSNYFDQNAQWCGVEYLTESEKQHVIQIGASILCTKWEIGYAGGGFVQSFVKNDLMGALGSADSTSLKGFKFFASIMYNIGLPEELFQYV